MRERILQKLRGTEPARDPGRDALARLPGDLPAEIRNLDPDKLTPAAVLVPIVDRSDDLTVLLTQRTDHLKHHPGQISFPGGRIEAEDEGPVAAALRETEEEVGLPADHVEVVGYLDTYLTITRYAVTPVVGMVRPGFVLDVDEFEVADAFEVPLEFLMDPANHVVRRRPFMGKEVPVYEIRFENRRIWGATASMLVGFYKKIFK